MSVDRAPVPPMIRQGELVQEIAREIVAGADLPWTELTFKARALAPYLEDGLYITRPGGRVESEYAPRSVPKLVRELREVMYRPGAGTWYSARWTISESGDVDVSFDYENQPAWSDPPPVSIFYTQDLARFPRDADQIPSWVAEQVELAKAPYPDPQP